MFGFSVTYLLPFSLRITRKQYQKNTVDNFWHILTTSHQLYRRMGLAIDGFCVYNLAFRFSRRLKNSLHNPQLGF